MNPAGSKNPTKPVNSTKLPGLTKPMNLTKLSELTEKEPSAGAIEELIVNWIINQNKLTKAKAYGGGWEVWAQVEITFLMEDKASVGKVQREKRNIYLEGDQRIDLYVEQKPVGKIPNIGVELKCRTKGESTEAFQQRVLKDIKKIYLGVQEEVKPVLMYSMAITNDVTDLKDWIIDNDTYPAYPTHYFKAGGWYVIAWGMAFLKPKSKGAMLI